MEARFRVEDLKRKIDRLSAEGIEIVEISFFEQDEIEGEIIAPTLEFYGFDEEGEEVDFGGIEGIE